MLCQNHTLDCDSGLFGTSVKIIFEVSPRKKSTFHNCEIYTVPSHTSTNLPTQPFKMAKDKSDKKERKEKKEKRSETDGVKKSKKEKKSKLSGDNIAAAIEEVSNEEVTEVTALAVAEPVVKPVGALVPFANPLADEKTTKKVLKGVKKGTSHS
jgi:hypothetical protein